MNATTCSGMLIVAVPVLFVYNMLSKSWCPMLANGGVPIQDTCYGVNIGMLLFSGLLVNGPYALITTAVSAELGTHKSLKVNKN